MTDSVIRSRIDSQIKAEATQLFREMGLNLSEAIRLFLYQSIAEKRIPFSINVPNKMTHKALETSLRQKEMSPTSLAQLSEDWDRACEK